MRPLKLICMVMICIGMIISGCRNDVKRDYIINDFETDADLDQVTWKCRTLLSLSGKHISNGNSCLKMELYPDAYPGIAFKNIKKNWAPYHTLMLDIFNPDENGGSCRIAIRIDDQKQTPPYNDRYNAGFDLIPGMNHLEISFTALVTPKGRPLDLNNIYTFICFMVDPKEKQTLYLDHVRLDYH